MGIGSAFISMSVGGRAVEKQLQQSDENIMPP